MRVYIDWSRLADLPPGVLTSCGQEWQVQIWQIWHLVIKNGRSTPLVVTSQWWRMSSNLADCYPWDLLVKNLTPWCSHLVFKNVNFTLLLTSSDQEWQFHTATHIYWSRMSISHFYWHLVQSRIAISHCYWYLVVKNGNLKLELTYGHQ